MRELGLSPAGIRRRVVAGRLHSLYRGVYAVGHVALSWQSRQLAAVLAAGPGAVLSHRSAGRLWDLIRWSGAIEVTTPRARKPRPGFDLHRSHCLSNDDRAVRDAIPVTSLARTVVDLAEVLDDRRLSKAVHEAEIRKLFDLRAVEEALARVPGRAGRHRLQRVLRAYGPGPRFTRSDGEVAFLALCDRHGLPSPESAVTIAGYELDFVWPGLGLAVELDGPGTHYTIYAYHEDRRRDRALAPHHIQVLRITPLDLENEQALAQELRRILAAKAA